MNGNLSMVLSPAAALLLALPGAGQAGHGEQDGGCLAIGQLDPEAPLWVPIEAPLALLITFDANVTAAQQAVINQAAAEWLALIDDAGEMVNPYPIHFQNGPLVGFLGLCSASWNSQGTLVSSTITIDNDGTSVFFVDPTPGDDSEFDAEGNCILTTCTSSDLLSVMRHEIGHALGWTGYFTNPPNPFAAPLVSGTLIDSTRLNVQGASGSGSHTSSTAFPGDLMNPNIPSGIRRRISLYPDLSVMSRVYNHTVQLRFVDLNGSPFFQTGTADSPWDLIAEADQFAPNGVPIVVIPATYDETDPSVLNSPRTYLVAKGGSVVIR